ncbi:MAG: hypothetical protein QOH53_1298 [Ilumatobacteraceae bacterium]
MNRHPILIALDALDDEPSAEFSEAMRARLYAELVQASDSSDAPLVDERLTPTEVEVEVDEQGGRTNIRAFEPRSKRSGSALAAVAGIVLVAALAITVATRRSEPTASDTTDHEIADTALISLTDLGSLWGDSHAYDDFSTRDQALLAAGIPGCAPYVDSVFDGPLRQAATSQKHFHYRGASSSSSSILSDVVSVFPSKAAASKVMDKIAEPAFRSCFASYLEAEAPRLSSGDVLTSHIRDAPPLVEHGYRQIAFETVNLLRLSNGLVPLTSVNIFIQIDRSIVYINPVVDGHDSLDPTSALEIVMNAATNSLTRALSQVTRS